MITNSGERYRSTLWQVLSWHLSSCQNETPRRVQGCVHVLLFALSTYMSVTIDRTKRCCWCRVRLRTGGLPLCLHLPSVKPVDKETVSNCRSWTTELHICSSSIETSRHCQTQHFYESVLGDVARQLDLSRHPSNIVLSLIYLILSCCENHLSSMIVNVWESPCFKNHS